MHRIDGPGATVDNKFTEGDPVGGVQATVVTDDWLNDVQENVMAVLAAGSITPTKGRAADLLDALKKVAAGRLLRTSVYTLIAGVQMVSVNGGPPTATGASTFTALALTTAIRSRAQGAAGGSGGSLETSSTTLSAGPGSGAGAYGEGWFTSGFSSLAITVGVGGAGAAATASATGGSGGTSSVGALMSSPGGFASSTPAAVSTVAGVFGGTAESAAPTGANLFGVRGGGGIYGLQFAGINGVGAGGFGGASFFGGGRLSSGSGTGPGLPGINYGAGASGAFSNTSSAGQVGGKGADGIVVIEEFA